MPSSGSAELRALAARLRAEGEGAMLRQMTAGMRAAAQPLVGEVKAAAAQQLPHSGGLAALVSGQKVTVSVRTGARTAGVRLYTRDHDTKSTNAGYVRHPVYGRPNSWVSQQIPQAAGWWTQTLRERSPAVTPALIAVQRRVAAEIGGI